MTDITIKQFAACAADVVGYEDEIVFITLDPKGCGLPKVAWGALVKCGR